MATKVKGLFKGLRYISHMFEEKDDEIQIGFPTDVKHVAHIGWDGPSANSTPSWMNDFKSSPEVSSAGQLAVKELSSQDMHKPGQQLVVHRSDIPRSRHHSPTGEPESSPTKKISDGSKKHSRRHRSKDGVMDSPSREAKEGSSRHSRRSRNSNNLGSESPSQDPPGIPKQRRKKGSSESGSARSSRRSSRSKGQNSMTDISLEDSEHGSKSGESPMHPVLAEEKGSEGFSGGNLN
ncbi:CRIB domain-containing protein RIC7 [Prunus avium]|uniref:CRIB domain-containing protein RIC7 n=1 Tax=Prunus avium TaxID=42229 RepID=A0A6P5RPY3_PRUAV|nr:CRIB domain-containing protein RIC7 [Prunus avium]